jgi:hypothetical protein
MYIIFIFIIIVICFIGMFVNTNTLFSYAPNIGGKPCDNQCPNPTSKGVQYYRDPDTGDCTIFCMEDAYTDVPIIMSKPQTSLPKLPKPGGGNIGVPSSGSNPGGIKCPPGQISNGNKCIAKPNGGDDKPVPIIPPGFDMSKCQGLGMDECSNKLNNIGSAPSCPAGQIIWNNICVNPQSMCVAGTVWDATKNQCAAPAPKCAPGQVVGPNGGCIVQGASNQQCPIGSMFKNGKCKVVSCSVAGQTVQNGQCVCPAGQQPKNGRCSVGGPNICPTGQQLINGKCVCPYGTYMRNNVCVLNPCPIGQTRQNGKCVPTTGAGSQNCPVGQIKNAAGKCVPTTGAGSQNCPVGQIKNAVGKCIPKSGGGGIAARR